MSKEGILDRLAPARVVAVVRTREGFDLTPAVEALVKGGVAAIEVTMTVPDALNMIRAGKERFGDRIVLGAGTLMERTAAEQAAEAGAEFLGEPVPSSGTPTGSNPAADGDRPWGLTPSETFTAWEAGAEVVKVFPIRVLGPQYLRDVPAPMPGCG